MSRPNIDTNFLHKLPTDLWAYVASFLAAEQLSLLKSTGSRTLWFQLQCPGVVKSVELGKQYFRLKSWPVLLNEFKTISELSIHSFSIDWWRNMSMGVHLIPSTLRKLKVTGKVDLETFFVNLQGASLYFDEQLPNLEELDLRTPSVSQSWLSHLPQTLTNMSIYAWRSHLRLPPLLIHLSVNYVYSDAGDQLRLPSGLQTFCIPELWDLTFLVPPLTSFKTNSLGDLRVDAFPNLMANLPRTLTEIEAPSDVLPPQCWPYLPLNLVKFTLNDEVSEWDIITRNFSRRSPTEFPFHFLPKSITHIHCLGRPNAQICFISSSEPIFPPQLTFLGAPNLFFAPNSVALLPPSLTHLELYNLCDRVCEVLPKGLKKLTAQNTFMSPALVRFLPASLISLNLICATITTTWFDYKTGEKLNLFQNLPELPFQKKFKSDDTWHAQPFPPILTSLTLQGFMDVRDSVAHQALPRLSELSILKCQNVTDLSIPQLGRHLTTLILPESLQITGECFPSLPKHLTSLNLRDSSCIYDSDVQHLPRSLKTIFFNSAIHLTNECFLGLPLFLETLSLRSNRKITQSCFKDLPFPVECVRPSLLFEVAQWRIVNGILIDKAKW